VPAVLLRGNSTDAYISYQSLLPEILSWASSLDTYRWILQKKIVPKPNTFTETRTQDSYRVCDLSSCNLLAETNNFVLCAVLVSCLVSELQKHLHRESNSEQFFGVVGFVYVIFSSKETTLVLAPFFYRV
jgi:hypothetical protein